MDYQAVLTDLDIPSAAVNRTMGVRVITPPGYDPAHGPYPVLYFLHPWGLSPRYITDKLAMHRHLWEGVRNGTLPPFVIVLPEGGKSFFINAADPPDHDWGPVVARNEVFFEDALEQYGRYGDYVRDEVFPAVEERFALRSDRAGRAIGGISMGGAGAVIQVCRAPTDFCALGMHSPALFLDRSVVPPWIFGVDDASFAARNPSDAIGALDPERQPRIWLDTGDEDMMLDAVTHLHHALARRGLAHEYSVVPGGHNKTYWEPRMPDYLAFYARDWS